MLRLGNDRQSFRWLSDGDAGHALLHIVRGPPYYTLLRALDHSDAEKTDSVQAPRTYQELNPRIWVGRLHASVGRADPTAGQANSYS